MTLKEFISQQGITVSIFATYLGMPYQTVYKYVVGERTPPLKVAWEIEKLTKHKVTMREMIND